MSEQAELYAETMSKTLLIGEQNPYGSDPYYALYPSPERSAGYRLCTKVMDLRESDYLRRFDRINLCGGAWSMKEARKRAALVVAERTGTAVLFGAKVAVAFGMGGFAPFNAKWTKDSRLKLLLLPHPSGLCRFWNEPRAYAIAREFLQLHGVL